MTSMDSTQLARYIDQTLLRPTAGLRAAADWIEASKDSGFASLCVAPLFVPLAAQRLAGTTTVVCSVVGFPLGYTLTETKIEETIHLAGLGCHEFDMVIDVGALIEGDFDLVRNDISAVATAVHDATSGTGLLKVILETGFLTEEQVVRGSSIAVEAGARYVKTSTGFGPRGASARDVQIMRETVGPDIGVKAAGGIRDLETALEMIEAGADRIGTSAGIEILAQASDAD